MSTTPHTDIEARIDELVKDWPPLTEGQIFRVQNLLHAPKVGGAG